MNTHPSLHDAPERPARACSLRRPGRFRRTALAAAVLAGAGGLMLAASGIAFASVDQTSPQWAQLGSLASSVNQANQVTAVYTIQNVAEPGTEMLEDNGNSMAANTTIDVWTRLYQGADQDPTGSGPQITQANYLWEFVPDNPGNGRSIVDGYGELINRQSGLCLDDDGSPNQQADGATITQYGCNGAASEQWVATEIPFTSSFQVQPKVDNGGGALGVGNGSTCSPRGDGDSVYVRTTGIGNNSCDRWDIQQASYDFATKSVNVSGYDASDGSSYGCLTGDTLRGSENGSDADYDNLSGPDVTPDLNSLTLQPNLVGGIDYLNAKPSETEPGQVMLYCDPATTTP